MSRHGTPEWEENKEVWADYFDFVCMSIGEKAFIDLGGAPAVSEESE